MNFIAFFFQLLIYIHGLSRGIWGSFVKTDRGGILENGATVRWSLIKTWLAPVGPMPAPTTLIEM